MAGIEELNSLDGIMRHNLNTIKKNKYIKPLQDKSARKTLILKADNRRSLDFLINRIKSILRVRVETEKGIKKIIWN